MSLAAIKERFREGLLESYRPRRSDGAKCAICGAESHPLSFHMIEFTCPRRAVPEGGVVMSQRSHGPSDVTTSGAFPICTSCAPPCRKCGLPVPSDRQQEFLAAITRGNTGCSISVGRGVCDHIKWRLFFRAVAKRALRLGRFASEPPNREVGLRPIAERGTTSPARSDVLMTTEEIQAFGVQVVAKYVAKEGAEIISAHSQLGADPQIVARRAGELLFIAVRTACYPSKGKLEDAAAERLREVSSAKGAKAMFASVGIANAKGTGPEEMALPVRGSGFYVSYAGLVAV